MTNVNINNKNALNEMKPYLDKWNENNESSFLEQSNNSSVLKDGLKIDVILQKIFLKMIKFAF